MSIKNFSFVLVLALGATAAGCATDEPRGMGTGSGSGDGSGSGSGNGSGGNDGGGTTPLDLAGNYKVQSVYNIEQNVPGTVGEVLNNFTAASQDPGKWIMNMIIAQVGNGTLKSVLQAGEGLAAGYIDQEINTYAPAFVQTILQVGTDIGDVGQKFGIDETYAVTGSGTTYTAVDTVTGVNFNIEGQPYDLQFANYQVANVVVSSVGMTLGSSQNVTIAQHTVPLSYGKVLQLTLDNVIIPLVDPNAANLGDLLNDLVDCYSIGNELANDLGFFSADTYASACTAGLNYGASYAYSLMGKIDASALSFQETGAAHAAATGSNVTAIQLGKWTGNLSYSGTPAPLASATFTGTRM